MNQYIRITKQFAFEMAHVLWKYDGPCKNIHGHSYRLFVTLIGKPLADNTHPKNGMVLDFDDLTKIVDDCIVNIFDHALAINGNMDKDLLEKICEASKKVVVLPYQPTCENLLVDFAGRIKPLLPPHTKLFSLKLHETENLFAEWFAEDNSRM